MAKMKRPGHPALALQLLEKKSRTGVSEIMHSPAWRKLDADDKRFLSLYLHWKDYKKAQVLANVSTEWLAERERDVDFQAVLQEALDHPVQVGLIMMAEAVPYAVVELFSVMEQNRNLNAKLKAIDMIFKATGVIVDEEEASGVENNQFNVQVIHWDHNKEPVGFVPEVEGRLMQPTDDC